MKWSLSSSILEFASKKKGRSEPQPLLVELFEAEAGHQTFRYDRFPFSYAVAKSQLGAEYSILPALTPEWTRSLRVAVGEISATLDPSSVEPLTFRRLVEVLSQSAAARLAESVPPARMRDLSELAAYEAIGLSRVLALARDDQVTEFYADSDDSPLYLDHSRAGRCDTRILLTERERKAIETHIDTFRGYSLDYANPSTKNDLEMSGARLRVSLDLEPISANRFSLDVRRLNISSLSAPQLVSMGVLCGEAAAFLVVWLEMGGNVTIVGETGTGKTTLLNALDEQVNPKLRRVYIEDAVETRDLLDRGYHQMKLKVDPFERGGLDSRTKGSEIVKALHRSPDLVILSEIQTEEHSKAFFHALSSGVRGIQTFHASSLEQAMRRWMNMHGIPKQNLLDLGVLVLMRRPDRLMPGRFVVKVAQAANEAGEPRLREIFVRNRQSELQRVTEWARVALPEGRGQAELECGIMAQLARLSPTEVLTP